MNLRRELANARTRLAALTPTAPRGRFPSPAWAWPTGRRDMLLRAAILEDLERAAAAYREWEAGTDFDEVDFPAMRLLVAIAHRIPDDILKAKDRARLGGIERKLWSESVMALRSTEPALGALERAGIDVMVLKGAVRTVLDFSNLRGRYASELDLLVRPGDFERAWNAIEAEGWQYVLGYRPRLDWIIGANLAREKSGQLDLHKYPYHQILRSDATPDALWSRAVEKVFLGHKVFVPSPTDRLLMALAHGGIGGHEQSDWLVDAALLIRGGEVDWDLFLSLARERGVEGVVAVPLAYLAGPLEQPLPSHVTERLAAFARRRPFAMMGAVLEARPKRELSAVSAVARSWARAVRMYAKSRTILRAEAKRRELAGEAETSA